MKGGQASQKEEEKKPRRRIKKVAGHGGHHGGAWKVAYADFVTAMMALFLVLWLVSQADTKLKEAIANYFRNPGVFSTIRGGVLGRSTTVSREPTPAADTEALIAAAEMLKHKFESNPQYKGSKEKIQIDITDEGLRIQIIDRLQQVSFPSGSSELTPNAREILTEIAKAICDLPNPIFIGGHTDRHLFPEGSSYTNWELSADRANAARRALEAACVRPEQVRRVIGHADTELAVPNDPYSEANRRITIIVRRLNADRPRRTAFGPKPQKDIRIMGEDAPPSKTAKSEEEKAAESAAKEEKEKEMERQLKSEGKVSVGVPDEIPEGVKRTRAKKEN